MISVEDGTVRDVDAIMPIMTSAFAAEFGEAWSEGQCIGALSMPNTFLAIARMSGVAVGFAMWREILVEAELLLIATDPLQQKAGAGSSLLNHCVHAVVGRGGERLFVEVRSDNLALSFYESRGFLQVGNRPNYYRRSDGGPSNAMTLMRYLLT